MRISILLFCLVVVSSGSFFKKLGNKLGKVTKGLSKVTNAVQGIQGGLSGVSNVVQGLGGSMPSFVQNIQGGLGNVASRLEGAQNVVNNVQGGLQSIQNIIPQRGTNPLQALQNLGQLPQAIQQFQQVPQGFQQIFQGGQGGDAPAGGNNPLAALSNLGGGNNPLAALSNLGGGNNPLAALSNILQPGAAPQQEDAPQEDAPQDAAPQDAAPQDAAPIPPLQAAINNVQGAAGGLLGGLNTITQFGNNLQNSARVAGDLVRGGLGRVCGNFCGPGWCAGAQVDETQCVNSGQWASAQTDGSCADACCREHDRCCSGDRAQCNTLIVQCLQQCGDRGTPLTCANIVFLAMSAVQNRCCGEAC